MIKNILKNNIRRGFTLVETLVAITILMISIGGPMVLVGNGINVSRFSRDQVTAFYIAQDAVEALRFLRDSDRISLVADGDPFNTLNDMTDQCSPTSGPCDIDTISIYKADGFDTYKKDWSGETLKIDGSTGYFRHNTDGEPSKFTRSIIINPSVDNDSEIDITITVTWNSGGLFGNKSFTIKESLFYWY